MIKRVFIAFIYATFSLTALCQIPTISPIMIIESTENDNDEDKDDDNNENKENDGTTTYSGPAPVTIAFEAQVYNPEGYNAHYEWRFCRNGNNEPYLTRYSENTEYTFNTYGQHKIYLYAILTKGSDRIEYTQDYWNEETPLVVNIDKSSLDFPNAFSPNGDGINDIYRAKKGWSSIVEFKACISNRWGQKLFEWTNPNKGWDGTYKGTRVKDGVYYVHVTAKGADGRIYNFKKDVNVLTGYTENKF